MKESLRRRVQKEIQWMERKTRKDFKSRSWMKKMPKLATIAKKTRLINKNFRTMTNQWDESNLKREAADSWNWVKNE